MSDFLKNTMHLVASNNGVKAHDIRRPLSKLPNVSEFKERYFQILSYSHCAFPYSFHF